MKKLNPDDVLKYVEENIGIFHQKRIQSLDKLKLSKVLERKNPYLFKAKYMLTAEQIVRGLTDAHISSSEETIFGDWLEGLAIFINNKVYGGYKSGITGIASNLRVTIRDTSLQSNRGQIGAITHKRRRRWWQISLQPKEHSEPVIQT